MKTYEVKIYRNKRECETIRGLNPVQITVLEEVFRHYRVGYKKLTYDDSHLESVERVEAPAAPDLAEALRMLVADIESCETEEDFAILATGGAIEQARAVLERAKALKGIKR